jgi:L-fuconolactonase
MPILDSQVHAYERNHSGRPWIGTLYGPPEVTGDQMVTAMDAVGVDGAILVSPFSMYRYDASYEHWHRLVRRECSDLSTPS